ncbi:MAG: FAD-dependent oxidoreductase [Gammaproteobacteria bacterium]|nr:FAD-dependent oxidoreductase [Gammaproteobacteria bacterium]MCG3146110.1 Rubredoxin-NAD(+) reductase [Gammaproteobacteria bacterium]
MDPLIIVGTGLGGYSLAREWRKIDANTPLLILTRDDGHYYSKPMLSGAYTGNKPPDAIALGDAAAMASQLKAEIRTRITVEELDTAAGCVRADGVLTAYSNVVLAVGADPIHVPVAGDAAELVMSVNDLADYANFRAAIATARHVTIIGAGLIGCEFANDLLSGGIASAVVDPAAYPLSRLLPAEAGAALAHAYAGFGVDWRFGRTVARVDREGTRLRVTLDGGEVLATDAVLSAIGLRPRTALAQAAGLDVSRGILVSRQLRTSSDRVYALGDCAEVDGLVLPYVAPIMQAARALASTLAGKPTDVAYPPMPVLVKTSRYPVVVAPPRPGVSGSWCIDRLEGGMRALYRAGDDRIEGFALLGSATAERQKLSRELPALLD